MESGGGDRVWLITGAYVHDNHLAQPGDPVKAEQRAG